MIIENLKFVFKKIKLLFKKLFWFLTNKPLWAISLILFLCCLLGLLIFYKYVFLPIQKDFQSDQVLIGFKESQYQRVIEKWQEKERELDMMDENEYYDIFFPTVVNIKKRDVIEEKVIEKLEEDIDLEKDLETLLFKTLFEFYEIQEGEMPLISERALIWEELGLGKAEEYKGYYSQNIIFLKTLKEKLPILD